MVNDTIADMLTRIRNANAMKYKTVEIPGTKMTKGIADILTKEGFIDGYDTNKLAVGEMIVLNLKYSKSKENRFSSTGSKFTIFVCTGFWINKCNFCKRWSDY